MLSEKIRVNFIFSAIYNLSLVIVPVITLPYLTRVLNAEGLGKYSFANSVASYFMMFIMLGLQNYGNRSIAFAKEDTNVLSKTFFDIYFFQLFMGGLFSIVYIIYCYFWAPDKKLAYIFFILIVASGIDTTWALYGLEEFRFTSLRDVTMKIVTMILIFYYVRNEEDVWKYALIYCLGFLLSQMLTIPVILRKIEFVKPSLAGIISHIKPNVILFLPTIATSIYKIMDKIMLGALSDEAELGYYHSSENVVKIPLALITALGTIMLPRMSNMLSKDDDKEVDILFSKSVVFAMFVANSICIGIMTVSQEFVPVYFGAGFEKCIVLFDIILPSCIFLAFANVIRTQYLLPRKKDKIYILSLFSGAGINLMLNFWLIPKYASIGAAIGTLAAEIMVCLVQCAFVYKEANIARNIRNSLPFIGAGMIMFILCRNIKISFANGFFMLLMKIAFSGMVYMVALGMFILLGKRMYGTRGMKISE